VCPRGAVCAVGVSEQPMRIALVNPVARNTVGYHTSGTRMPPLGLQVLARLTPAEHTVEIIDEVFGTDDTEKFLTARGYDLVGITSYTSSATRAYELAALCRRAGVPTIMGGPHAWACPDEAQRYFDSVAVGECDALWPAILGDLRKGALAARYTGELADLSAGLGRADQDIQAINGRYDIACIQTSRGCPVGCDFCSVTRFNGPKIRRRNADDIVDEWNSIRKRFVFVVDDNFYGISPTHAAEAREILQAIIRRGKRKHWFSQTSLNMGGNVADLKLAHRAGCLAMLVGIETFDDENLKAWKKGLNRKILNDYQSYVDGFHAAGVAVLGAFVIGADNDTQDTAAETLLRAVRLGVDIIQVTNLTPLPGTALYERLLANGRIHAGKYPEDWERYTFIETVFRPQRMDPRQLDESMYEMRRLAAGRKWVWKRSIKTLLKTRSLATTLFVHGVNDGWRRMALALRTRDEQTFAGTYTPEHRMAILRKCYA